MRTRIEVGIPKFRARPPTVVRPPTEPGQATLPGTIVCNSYVADSGPVAWDLPDNMLSGDLAIALVTISNNQTLTTPTGWTLENSFTTSQWTTYVLYRIIDGTETDPTTLSLSSGSNADWTIQTWYLRANGVDFSLTPPESNIVTAANGVMNPPSLSPTHGSGNYWVFAGGWRTFDWLDDPLVDTAPTDYTDFDWCVAAGVLYSDINYRLVEITTAEDPAAYGESSGVRGWIGITIAVKEQPSGSGDVAAGDHTHVEADVTDLTHTDGDAIHDNVAGEISAVAEKVSPVSADLVLIEDSEAANVKKRVQLGNLPGGGGSSDHGTLTGLTDDDHNQYLLAAGTRAATYLEVSGLTGATGSSPRFVGGTTTGAPASGTFVLGDYVVTEDGNIYVCTTAGTPGTWTAVGATAATDSDAIHDNVAGEIAAITAKATPTTSDFLLIEDAAASNAKKRITIGDLPSGGSGGLSWVTWTPELYVGANKPTQSVNFAQYAVSDDMAFWRFHIDVTGTVANGGVSIQGQPAALQIASEFGSSVFQTAQGMYHDAGAAFRDGFWYPQSGTEWRFRVVNATSQFTVTPADGDDVHGGGFFYLL